MGVRLENALRRMAQRPFVVHVANDWMSKCACVAAAFGAWLALALTDVYVATIALSCAGIARWRFRHRRAFAPAEVGDEWMYGD